MIKTSNRGKGGWSMIFVVKKNVILAAAFILLAAIVLNVTFFSDHTAVNSVPITNRTIVLDPGHGGEDGGAVGSNGTVEKEINLQVALKVQALLEQNGCSVFMTRSEDVSIHDKGEEKNRNRKISDLDNRKKMPGDYKADAFVSIHMNLYPQQQYHGAQVFYAETPESSMQLAQFIQDEMREDVDSANNREIKEAKGNIYVLDKSKVPSVVVECGFLSNPEEEQKLQTEEYQQKLAFAIYSGIIKFFAA